MLIPEVKLERSEQLFNLKLENIHGWYNRGSIGVSCLFYPYNSAFQAGDYQFFPYEEYVEEVQNGGRSTYIPLLEFGDKFFGLFLGVLIFILFFFISRENLFSVESMVSIIGAYIAGKELWGDFDQFLQETSDNQLISWKEREYFYRKTSFGSFQPYIRFGRKNRYESESVLPSRMDFINQSNSKLLELKYTQNDLKKVKKDELRFLSVNFMKSELPKTQEFMLTVKITKISNFGLFETAEEFMQSLNAGKSGVLDRLEKWKNAKIRYRKTLKIGNLKLYLSNSFIKGNIFSF